MGKNYSHLERIFNRASKTLNIWSWLNQIKYFSPPLNIKLGLMKQFVKSMEKHDGCFAFIFTKFPKVSSEELKAGIFDGSNIRTLMKVYDIQNNEWSSKIAWVCHKAVINQFLGKNREPNYKQIVDDMLVTFQKLVCRMSLKIHFLFSHVDYFLDNLNDYSEEMCETFY